MVSWPAVKCWMCLLCYRSRFVCENILRVINVSKHYGQSISLSCNVLQFNITITSTNYYLQKINLNKLDSNINGDHCHTPALFPKQVFKSLMFIIVCNVTQLASFINHTFFEIWCSLFHFTLVKAPIFTDVHIILICYSSTARNCSCL